MWPFSRKTLKQKKAEEQVRLYNGQFAAPAPTYVVKQAEADLKVATTQMNQLDSMLNFMDRFNERIDQAVEARLAEYEGESDPTSSLINQLAPLLIPILLKQQGLSTLSQQAAVPDPLTPSGTAPVPPALPSFNGTSLIKQAASASPSLIKAAMAAKGYSELEKQGISQEEFKQAITNMYKAIGLKE